MNVQQIVAWVVIGLQVAIVAASVVTLIRFGNPRKREDQGVAWLIVAWAVTSMIDAISWITLALMVILPYWVYLLGFACAAGLSWWRTWLIRPLPGRRRR